MQAYIEIFLDLTGNLATAITLAITIITSASLLLVNVARYFQAKKFGIPLNMINQASLSDSLDLWVILISAFGFGRIIPEYVTSVNINIFAAFVITFISIFASFMFLRSKAQFRFQHGKAGEMVASVPLTETARGVAVMSFVVAWLFIYSGYVNRELIADYTFTGNLFQNILRWITLVILWLHMALITIMFIVSIIAKIYGDKDAMTVDIDGQTYLLATRHNSIHWALMPCEIKKITKKDGCVDDTISFTKGRFIIRDMATIKEQCHVVCRKGYALFGTTEDDKDM